MTRLRALVILPTRDLVSQGRDTFEALSKGTGLKVGSFPPPVNDPSSDCRNCTQLEDSDDNRLPLFLTRKVSSGRRYDWGFVGRHPHLHTGKVDRSFGADRRVWVEGLEVFGSFPPLKKTRAGRWPVF